MDAPRQTLRGRIVSIDILASRPAFGLEIETGLVVRCINFMRLGAPDYKRGDTVTVSGQWSTTNKNYFHVFGMKAEG